MITELAVMEECSSAKRFKLSNKDLNPTLEMLVNDFDDERTLDEEEALESNEDPLAELSSLQKTISVGSQHQAVIPEGLSTYDDALPYENEDKLLWDPNILPSEEVDDYLKKFYETLHIDSPRRSRPSSAKRHIRDDDQALYLLLQCGYSSEEALRRQRMNVVASTDTMSLWSEEECQNFECGLRLYGKNFHCIQQCKVRTRSVGELVNFYYLWKKTERHDIFANNTKFEKKKYSLHPGTTDFMDRFLEEQESGGGTSGSGTTSSSGSQRDGSSSPNIQCLIYGDRKRRRKSNKNTYHVQECDVGSATDVSATIEDDAETSSEVTDSEDFKFD